MSDNIVMEPGYRLSVVCTNPATPASGDPVRYGVLTGVALTNESAGGNASGYTTVYFGPCVVDVSVAAVDGNGNSAVAVGDTIFYVDADTPKLSKKATGYFFGFALETITSGSTATIQIYKPASPGAGTLAAGGVGATQLATSAVETDKIAANAVTAAKLTATMATGFVPVALTGVRELTTGSLANAAANGGLLATDTTPILNTTNGDTDGAWRLAWAASNSDAIGFQVPLPPDLDDAAAVTIHLRAAMAGTTDTVVISADSYFNEGDTKVEDDSDAVTGTSYAEYTITIAAADVPAGAQTLSVELTPAAHTTDALYVTAIWVEYSRV